MIYLVSNQKKIFESEIVKNSSIDEFINWSKNFEEIGLDTETTGFMWFNSKLLTIQFGNFDDQFIIDLTTINIDNLKSILEDKNKLFILQNAKFDLRFLLHHRIIPSKVYDTYLAEVILTNGELYTRKNLDALGQKYLNQTISKENRGLIHKQGLTDTVLTYCANDVKYLKLIKDEQLKVAKIHNLTRAIDLDNLFVIPLSYIEYSGFTLDREKWINKMTQDKVNLQNAEDKLNNFIIDNKLSKYIDAQLDMFNTKLKTTINWNSSKQVTKLFNELGIDVSIEDKETGNLKFSVNSKKLTSGKETSPIIPLYIEYKKYQKICSTYGINFLNQINKDTGRIYTSFTQLMNTGRLSSGGKDKNNKVEFINFQNIPSDETTRSCFIAGKNNILIDADYSGQEQIVLVNQCMDDDLLYFYNSGLNDMHSFVASKIYPELNNLSLDDIKKYHKNKRQIAKSAGFAINYGGNGLTIAENLGISEEEGNSVYKAYFDAFPGLREYFKKVQKKALETGFIQYNEITKRKYFVPYFKEFKALEQELDKDFWEDYRYHKKENTSKFPKLKEKVREYFKKKGDTERIALNYPIQGTSADITKYAIILYWRTLIERNLVFTILIPNIIHDEIIIETPKDIANEESVLLKECMEKAGSKFCTTIKLKADPCITDNWKH